MPSTPAPDASLVALIEARPEMAQRIAAEHTDDGHGRCRACSKGAHAPRHLHPCPIRLAVEEARRRLALTVAVPS